MARKKSRTRKRNTKKVALKRASQNKPELQLAQQATAELKESSATAALGPQITELEQQLADEINAPQADKSQAEVEQLQLELSNAMEQQSRLSDELDLSSLQIAQLQEELETIYLEKQHLTDAADMQQKDKLQLEVNQLRLELSKAKEEQNKKNNELALSLSQIAQLKEELETLYLKNKTLENQHLADVANMQQKDKLQLEVKRLRLELSKAKEEQGKKNKELIVSLSQNAQLQKELNITSQKNKMLENQHLTDVINAQRVEELQKTVSQFTTEAKLLGLDFSNAKEDLRKKNNELTISLSHNAQLQKELETLTAKIKTLEKQHQADLANAQRAEELQKSVLQLQVEGKQLTLKLSTAIEQKENNSAELELSLLQITQLQEELEHYYLKYSEQQGVNHTLAKSFSDSAFSGNSMRLMRELIYPVR